MNINAGAIRAAAGWFAFLAGLMALASLMPQSVFTPGNAHYVLLIGSIGIWRYSLGITHFLRGMLFLYWVFPKARKQVDALGDAAMPSKVYLMVTSFRIDAHTTAAVYKSVIEEAAACGVPATVVASIVELSDENIVRSLWQRLAPPPSANLRIVRIPGTGKRDGLAHGFRAISRDMPPEDAVVAVVDGDTVLKPGVMRKTAPFLKQMPNVGALTTNEFCRVEGSWLMSEWHKLRFAQRHINMCSMALSKRVLTLTGRMSVFRADVVTNPGFIYDVENDHLDHWRLGRFKFLTGDDKSSWYSLMRLGYDTYYVPDAAIDTVEHPPDKNFVRASRKLMFRWYGNSLRQNSRATKLGVGRLGLFCYYVLLDQRVSMWTGLLGLTASIVASFRWGAEVLFAYFLWIGMSRLAIALMLRASGHQIGPSYPLILYYNQIFGSIMKIYVFFHLDQQSWTRQKTTIDRGLSSFQRRFNTWSSHALTFAAASVFFAVVVTLVSH
jgi:glycosyltransferase Alg8